MIRTRWIPACGYAWALKWRLFRGSLAAVFHLIEDQFGLMRDRIPRAVGALLGIKRVSSGEAAGIIDQVVDDLAERGHLRISGWNVYLCQ